MSIDLPAIVDGMNDPAATAHVVAIEAVVTTPSGAVALVARHSDGRNLAMMLEKNVTTHPQMVALAQAAFDAQHTGPIPG